jgi:hypothetical protein
MKRLVYFLICLLIAFPVSGHEHKDGDIHEVRVLKHLFLKDGKKAVVLVREGGHILGQPFQVEIRANCQTQETDYQKWPVQDSFSVCDLSPESVKVNQAQTAVALKTKRADTQKYDDQLSRGVSSPDLVCHEKTQIKKFSLKTLCQRGL